MSHFTRYTQQFLLPEIGLAGQEKLQAASVLVVGAGGLGTPLSVGLAAMGVGTLGIVDGDKVETGNLHRQFIYTPADIGQNKAAVIQQKLLQQNPDITINYLSHHLTTENATDVLAAYDIVCDCTDNIETRTLIDAVCKQLNKPLVYAAVSGWEGYVTVLHYHKKVGLQQAFPPENNISGAANCTVSGIAPPVCSIAANHQATEVLKIILGLNDVLDGKILCFNARLNIYRVLKLLGL
jgi:molybdopterin/thiamine biosynthesis adenylyltransferase